MASNAATGEDTFNRWNESTNGRGMTLVTAGQSGAGKSTLVKNLLRLSDQDADAPLAAHSANSVTRSVELYSSRIKNVNVNIIDTPGLAGASDDAETKVLAQLCEKSKGKADMLLYCVSMAPNAKVGELDRRIVNLLTMAFAPQIWERAIVVLTSADYIKERNEKNAGKPTVQRAMREYATAFQRILGDFTDGMTVIPVLQKEHAKTRRPKQIAAVAAGETPDEEILPGVKWNECVYKEVLKKCSPESMPEIFKILEVSSGAWKGAAGGAAAGILGGAATGAAVGFAAGGIGVVPGAISGAIVGGVVGGGSGYGVAHHKFKNSDQGKLAKEYEDIKKQRITDAENVNAETREDNAGTQHESKKNK